MNTPSDPFTKEQEVRTLGTISPYGIDNVWRDFEEALREWRENEGNPSSGYWLAIKWNRLRESLLTLEGSETW